ncbi:MAG: hypothetical protein GX547_08410 [Phycisphaerae bacterium]|nr:hypothetical protein [Phycisphaerae bacterium]
MKRALGLTFAGLFLLLTPAALAQTTREAAPDPAEWVPADALFYLGIPDTAQLWKDFQNTVAYKMSQDKELAEMPSMSGVWGKLAKTLKERLAQLVEVEVENLKNPLAGPLAFYIAAAPGAGLDTIEPVVVAGVGDQQLMKQYFDSAVARLKTAARSYETVTAAGQTIHVFRGAKPTAEEKAQEDELEFELEPEMDPEAINEVLADKLDDAWGLLSPDKLPEKLALCFAGDRLIASATPDRIKSVLARERGGETLAATEDHKLLLSSLKPVGQIRLLGNLPRVFEMLRRDAEGEEAASLRQTLDIIGAGSLRAAVGHCRLGSKSYDSKIEVLFLMSGERTGLARILSMENKPLDPPSWTTSDTAMFASLNIDPPKLIDDVLRIVAQTDPKAAEEARAAMEQVPMPPDGQPINLRKDLIDHLAGPLVGAVDLARPYGPGSLRGMIALGHRNRDALARVLTPLLAPGQEPRNISGNPAYNVPYTGGTLAIGNDRLLVGSQATVEAALSGGGSSGLTEDTAFRRAQRNVPKEAWCVMYIDQRKWTQGLMELARKKEQLAGDPSAIITEMILQNTGMDFSDEKLNQKMLQYSAPSILTISTTTQGIHVSIVGLNPEQEED